MALAQKKLYTIDDIYALPEGQRAELIDGDLYNLAPPVRIHQHLLMNLSALIHRYIKSRHGDYLVYPAPFAVFLNKDNRNHVEPDISVICDRSKLDNQGCSGAPDWINEIISPSNPGHDYIRKLNLYADAGVREYWIVDPTVKEIAVYRLENSIFRADLYTFQDTVEVNIYKDFHIDFSKLDLDI